MFKCRSLGMSVKRRLYEGVGSGTALYGAETWNTGAAERKRLTPELSVNLFPLRRSVSWRMCFCSKVLAHSLSSSPFQAIAPRSVSTPENRTHVEIRKTNAFYVHFYSGKYSLAYIYAYSA